MVILIIRHCDKPYDKNNPCCSEEGYKRAEMWKNYFKNYTNLITYTAGFRTNPSQCLKNFSYYSNKHCQHSQRMLLTSYIIGKPILYNYCIGDEKRLVNDVIKRKDADSLIVWQHEGIPKILDYMNIPNYRKIDTSLYDQVIIINNNKLLSMNRQTDDENDWISMAFVMITLFGLGLFCVTRLFSKRREYVSIRV